MSGEFSLVPGMIQTFGFDIAPEISIAADIIALIALIIALITFLLNQLITHKIAKRQHTLELLSIINEEGPVSSAQIQMALWIRSKHPFPDDNVSVEEDKIIIPLLDYYDFVCHNVIRRVLDTETVKVHIGGRMRATYFLLENYIVARRSLLEREALYTPFETVVRNIIGDEKV